MVGGDDMVGRVEGEGERGAVMAPQSRLNTPGILVWFPYGLVRMVQYEAGIYFSGQQPPRLLHYTMQTSRF